MSKPASDEKVPTAITIPVTPAQVARLDSLRGASEGPGPSRTAYAAFIFERGLEFAEIRRATRAPARKRAARST